METEEEYVMTGLVPVISRRSADRSGRRGFIASYIAIASSNSIGTGRRKRTVMSAGNPCLLCLLLL
ncbi:MAG TPA: hypothetical protein VLR47_00265, partial [Rhodospirillales bacterium]|nr:hypothetical protein [Rhodospirillales bacterium]